MWLYSVYGFFSVVQKPGDNDLTIRSRVRSDLERLRRRYLPQMSEITESALSDYRFRATAPHAALADAVYLIAQDIDYSDFKSTVGEKQGATRARIYADVWNATFGLGKVRDTVSAGDESRSPAILDLCVPERTMMRALYSIHAECEGHRQWRCMPFYAVTEKLGLVAREKRKNTLAPEEYSKELARDGAQKGWIREPLSQDEWHMVFHAFVYRFLRDSATFRNGEPWAKDH